MALSPVFGATIIKDEYLIVKIQFIPRQFCTPILKKSLADKIQLPLMQLISDIMERDFVFMAYTKTDRQLTKKKIIQCMSIFCVLFSPLERSQC